MDKYQFCHGWLKIDRSPRMDKCCNRKDAKEQLILKISCIHIGFYHNLTLIRDSLLFPHPIKYFLFSGIETKSPAPKATQSSPSPDLIILTLCEPFDIEY